MAAPTSASLTEKMLVELSQWLSRVAQYSATHPSCAQMGEKMLATLNQALAGESVIELGILKDEVMYGEQAMRHPAIRTRLGPTLHARGVLVLRFFRGVTLDELTRFVELLTLPVQTIFDRGGLVRLALEQSLTRVQFEEIAHDITNEVREAQVRRTKLRTFFRDMLRDLLARRGAGAAIGEQLAELLEHPDIAVTILEEDPVGLAEAAAGLALMTEREEQRTGLSLAPKMREVFLALAPASRDRMILGFPALAGDFRRGLAWAIDGFSERQLAKLTLPSVRAHAHELDIVLYALTSAVPHDGTRFSALRWLGLALCDLPAEEAGQSEMLAVLSAPVPEYDSFRRERQLLHDASNRAMIVRDPLFAAVPPSEKAAEVVPIDARRVATEVITIATRTRSFDSFCRQLPGAASVFADEGATDGVLGMLRALSAVTFPDFREIAAATTRAIAATPAAAKVLVDLEVAVETAPLDEMTSTVKLFAMHAPSAVMDRLDVCANRKLRRIMLDSLPAAGEGLLALVRPRLRSSTWFIVRNAVQLLAHAGGSAADLVVVCRHPDERVRLEIVRSLRTMTLDQAAMDIVAACLTDRSQEVRHHSSMLLRGDLLGPKAIAELERIASDESQSEELRQRIVHALSQSRFDSAADALFKLLQPGGLIESSAATAVRDSAASALRQSRAPTARALFEQGLNSTARRVRKACQRAAEGGS
jgi:hypothetical protein